MIKSFITGSFAYGTPIPESDLDLVIYADAHDAELLLQMSDVASAPEYWDTRDDVTSVAARFGKLNVLIFLNLKEFLAWKEATEELIEKKPVTRAFAVEYISRKVQECRKL